MCFSVMCSCSIVYFATCTSDSQFWGYILNILRKIIVIVLHGLKFLFSLQVLCRQFYKKTKKEGMMPNYFVCHLNPFNIHCSGLNLVDGGI